MSVMYTHAMIVSDSSDKQYKFIPSALHPFDQMKFVMEQMLYKAYLTACCGNGVVLNDLDRTIRSYWRVLPNKISTSDIPLNTLYQDGIRIIETLDKNGWINPEQYHSMQRIFARVPMQTYYNSLYTCTITKNFLDQLTAVLWTPKYIESTYPDGKIYECAVYIPQVKACKGADTEQVIPDMHQCIELAPKVMESFEIKAENFGYGNWLIDLLARFDMRRYGPEELVAMLAGFSIDHSKYVMTNRKGTGLFSIPDICYDLVTGSSFVFLDSAGKNRIPDLDNWLRALRDMVLGGKLKTTQDNELFGEFLAKIGTNSDIVNYFTKPITQISATEALAFRSSTFADFISDRLIAGNEDLDESEPSEKKVLPEIDPNKMLLELASPSESMSDYIYRETVATRISMILKNPPENAMPNDLLMLKRWRSRWLYLASISCLRDFLTRVSLRLSM